MSDVLPTRGAALELAEEKRFMEMGYEFLDEKRTLLAKTLLDELERWREVRVSYDEAMTAAVAALKAAIARHGVESLELYPGGEGQATGLDFRMRRFLGLDLFESGGSTWKMPGPFDTLDASQSAEDCRAAFAALVPIAVLCAVHANNITRLIRDYQATERRSRALENVILPETTHALARVEDLLSEIDQEEALRTRMPRR